MTVYIQEKPLERENDLQFPETTSIRKSRDCPWSTAKTTAPSGEIANKEMSAWGTNSLVTQEKGRVEMISKLSPLNVRRQRKSLTLPAAKSSLPLEQSLLSLKLEIGTSRRYLQFHPYFCSKVVNSFGRNLSPVA